MERELGVDRSFWIAVALAYLEYLTEREVSKMRSNFLVFSNFTRHRVIWLLKTAN